MLVAQYLLGSQLIALCQRYDLLPTDGYELADELQSIAADECYISKNEIYCELC